MQRRLRAAHQHVAGITRTVPYLALAVIVVSIALLFGVVVCSDPPPKVGEIVEKHYDDPDDWYQAGYTIHGSCQTVNNVHICQPDVQIPGQWHHDSAHWHLVLDDGERRGSVEVSESTYLMVSIGQWFNSETGEVVPR